ncbi:DNA polymerase III subunit beta [Amycolatopsis sp.]|uniref:DNA polymerase III subunit beta n=1 Tax=Amycolatopsis sp. TaxID=37632 RepID=UPI002CF4D7EA|nr:DNA polymerase III subunit beta [Amycolatopsis sp.]HVV12120.1 DNA polymerase III subunit beta [Amycolatopsis sp.]
MTGTARTARAPHASPTNRIGFTTDRARLADALTAVGPAVPKRPAVPILGGALLNAHDGGLTISATDYDTEVTARLSGTVHTTGALLVDHHEFAKLLAALVKGTRKRDADRLAVTVRTANDDGTPVVDLAGYTVPVTSYPVEEYPTIPDPGSALVHVDRETFTRDMARVLVAVSKDSTCPMLTGINLELTPGTVTMAATDRFRVAVAPLPAISRTGFANSHALVPGHLIPSVKRFSGDRVRIALDDVTDPSLVSFTSDDVTVSVRALRDQFPDYRQLMPTTAAGTVHTERAALLAATCRAAAVLGAKRDRSGHVAMTVTAESIAVAPVLDDRADSVTAPQHPATVAWNY